MSGVERTADYSLDVIDTSLPGQGLSKTAGSGVLRQTGFQAGSGVLRQTGFQAGSDLAKLTPAKPDRSQWNAIMQKFSTRTQRNFKIAVAVGVTSFFAFLAILFLSGISKSIQHNGETIIVQHKIEKEYEIQIGSDAVESTGGTRPGINSKIMKSNKGKAMQYDGIKGGSSDLSNSPNEADVEFLGEWPVPSNGDISNTLDIVQRRVNLDRKEISNKELRFWEPGSEPLRLLLVSTWNAGSEVVQKFLQSHPGVFQHYEPLSYLGLKQVRSGKQAFQAQQLIHRLLDCEYDNIKDYMNHVKGNVLGSIAKNKELWESCKQGPNRMVCAEESFLSQSCKMFPIQFIKTSRLRLNLTQLLLNDKKLNAKVIYVVRDPRDIINTRQKLIKECEFSEDCTSASTLCQDTEGDLKVAAAFQKLYPERFRMIKYEDIVTNFDRQLNSLFSFLNLEMSPSLINQVSRQSKLQRTKSWKVDLTPEKVSDIESKCSSIIRRLNY